MTEIPYLNMTLAVFAVAFGCAVVQKFFKEHLDPDQYYYLKDITLIGAWALFGIWTQDIQLRITIAAAVVAGCIGFCQKVSGGKSLRCLYFLVGFAFALFGPRVAFMETTDGHFFYLSNIASLFISGLWVSAMPIFFQEVDEIPGMCGLLLTGLWAMMSAVILTSSQNLHDLSQLCITGLVFLVVFWNRHLNAYRRLTESLASFWGTLIAAVLVYAISHGCHPYALIAISFGMLLIPLAELTISVASALFSPTPAEGMMFYRKLINHQIEHSMAVHIVVSSCLALGCIAACLTLKDTVLFVSLGSMFALFICTQLLFSAHRNTMTEQNRNPKLWGISVDNISLNYALARVGHWINSNEHISHLIITPDALAALRSINDKRYRKAVADAGLVLPDGAGLIAAFKILGSPIQERLPGVEFVEHLCHTAASEGWKIFIFGGKQGIAETAAEKLKEKYQGLIVAGTRNGYFKEEETETICNEIKASGADILFVGLGVPKQEYWLSDNLQSTGAVAGMGIGGSMDVISGNLQRAPAVWQKLCLEWLYRTIQEPWRWKRLLNLPKFAALVFLTKIKLYKYKEN